nr:hypothetical protein CcurKRNrm1_p159 [Cryptomonas curvata]
MKSKKLNYKKICWFLNQKLWFQFDLLNQKFVLLIKNSYLIIFLNQTNTLFNIYSKILIKYFSLYDKLFFSIIPYNTLSTLLVGICRFELIYIEDKIIFLEKHMRSYWKNNLFKVSVLPILLFELISFRTSINNNRITRKIFFQRHYLYLFLSKLKIKNFYNFKNKQIDLFLKKNIFNCSNNLNFKSIFNFKCILKTFLYIQKISIKTYSHIDHYNLFLNKTKYFNFIYIFFSFFCKIKDDEKKDWFYINTVLRIIKSQKNNSSFLEKFQLYDNLFYLYFSYFKKQSYLKILSFILTEKFKEKKIRMSHIGRWVQLFPSEIELIWIRLFINYNQKNILNKNRQIFKFKKNRNTFINHNNSLELDKQEMFIILYKNFLSFFNVLKKKTSQV